MKKLTGTPKRCVFRVLLILLIVAMTVSGCGKKAAFEKGFGYTSRKSMSMFGARADTDLFPKDNVTFDFCCGIYDIGYCKKYNTDPKSAFGASEESNLIFAIYLSDSVNFQIDEECADYKAIDNCYFVKEISEEEAFSEKYGYTMSYWKGIFLGQGVTYNNCESITVPAELFTEENGVFYLYFVAFQEPTNEGGTYSRSHKQVISFPYQVIDEGTVKLK